MATISFTSLLGWVPAWLASARPPRTVLHRHALVVRTGSFSERTVAWGDVLEVQLPGRWDVYGNAVLRGGSRLALPGVDGPDIERLAQVVARHQGREGAAHGPAAAVVHAIPSAAPTDDLGMEGPFRTARRRR